MFVFVPVLLILLTPRFVQLAVEACRTRSLRKRFTLYGVILHFAIQSFAYALFCAYLEVFVLALIAHFSALFLFLVYIIVLTKYYASRGPVLPL